MSGSPAYKVYRGGKYVAACKFPEDAAAILSLSGGEIRLGHSARDVLFREGSESVSASDSHDAVANLIYTRMQERIDAIARAPRNPQQPR